MAKTISSTVRCVAVLRPSELNAYLAKCYKNTERERGAVPPGPQQQAAETDQAVAVRLEAAVHRPSVRVEAAETRAEQDGARERDGAADRVHVRAAAEVHEADVGRASEGAGEPAVEHPVIEHGVHPAVHKRRQQNVALEARALGHGARRNGGAGHGKHPAGEPRDVLGVDNSEAIGACALVTTRALLRSCKWA